jgi:hypothetical protein
MKRKAKAKPKRATKRRVVRVAQSLPPGASLQKPETTTPEAFMRVAHGIAGGRGRARNLSRKRRQEIAVKAAQTRWHAQETTCKAEPVTDDQVTCSDCGVSWQMGDVNYPICPRLSHLQVMPPVQVLEERAREICFRLLHGGNRCDFDSYLPRRPDWQAHVNFVVMQLMETVSL